MNIYMHFHFHEALTPYWRVFELKRIKGDLNWKFRDYFNSETRVLQHYPSSIKFPNMGPYQIYAFDQEQFEHAIQNTMV